MTARTSTKTCERVQQDKVLRGAELQRFRESAAAGVTHEKRRSLDALERGGTKQQA
eukprot:CAMPEP_0185849178 /NCGR_PEP_ID=MMETSP1354-20130828/3769_1 /TAXON_ID=708628 /ORGANISM="Erythrolobus madagascarensis, Strain CCMP3276" /LENGTH=55 /DNA_ID=CAMNT_0028549661 /DNA_START=15 /DNA_END=182 /DNA_ORIENTATION=+